MGRVTQYVLIGGADTAKLGDAHYLFDRTATFANVVNIPTQRISARAARVVATLRGWDLQRRPRTQQEIESRFRSPQARAFVAQLIRKGYLEPIDVGTSRGRRGMRGAFALEAQRFRERGMLHFFKKHTFFNLPDAVGDAEADVGLFGVPFSSTQESTGSVHAPAFLRALTGRRGFWFDIHRDGFHSDAGLAGTLGRVLGKGVVAKDYGDVGDGARRVGDLFGAIDAVVRDTVVAHGIRPLFVGGDHAVTFPVVHALLAHFPGLCVLHLDAHHDLFYTAQIDFHHAVPMQGLLSYSGLERLCSMGLRTTFDPRVEARSRFAGSRSLTSRARFYSLPALRRLLAKPGSLGRELERFVGRRPCYLSIDVDVVSASALSGRTSTAAGAGLDWPELLEVVQNLFATRHVIGADVVELDPFAARTSDGDEITHLPALVALLVHGLARSHLPPRARGAPRGQGNRPPVRRAIR